MRASPAPITGVLSRRSALRGLLGASALPLLPGCAEIIDGVAGSCPADPADSGDVTWIPDVAHPVSWGVHDLTAAADGTPRDMMIYYPAAKEPDPVIVARAVRSPPGPAISLLPREPPPVLKLCIGRWPVVLFLHGQPPIGVPINGYHRRWRRLPSTLARCGYVVVVPNHNPGIVPSSADVTAAMRDVAWVRTQWSDAAWVDQRPTSTAVGGHSLGGPAAARVARDHPDIAALVSLSGHHVSVAENIDSLAAVTAPSFFMWTEANFEEDLDRIGVWDALDTPKYAAVYEGEHFDYLETADAGSAPRGPCPHMPALAADLAALFIASNVASLTQVPVDLSKPQAQLTPLQQEYAEGHLSSFEQFEAHPGCRVDIKWRVGDAIGRRRLPTHPLVQLCFDACETEHQECLAANLVDDFTCATERNTCRAVCTP